MTRTVGGSGTFQPVNLSATFRKIRISLLLSATDQDNALSPRNARNSSCLIGFHARRTVKFAEGCDEVVAMGQDRLRFIDACQDDAGVGGKYQILSQEAGAQNVGRKWQKENLHVSQLNA